MYSDKKKKLWLLLMVPVLAVVVSLFLIFRTFSGSSENLEEETAKALKQMVERTALECYTVEGAYPESLNYMIENYGLQANTKDYLIVYQAYASNVPPDIRVILKDPKEN